MVPTLLQDLQGTIVRRRAVPGFRLTENLYERGFRTPRHYHDHGLLGCVQAGSYSNTYGRVTHDVRGSAVMFCPPGEVHQTASPLGARCLTLEVEPAWMDRIEDLAPLDRPAVCSGSALDGLALRLYREFHETDAASVLAIEGLALEILALVMRGRSRPAAARPSWLEGVRRALDEHFTEPFGLVALAGQAGVHPVYLASAFRRHYGHTLGDYVRQRRITFAARRLSHSKDSLAEIAQASGFSDQSHFSRTFKRLTGMTPGRYRALFGGTR